MHFAGGSTSKSLLATSNSKSHFWPSHKYIRLKYSVQISWRSSRGGEKTKKKMVVVEREIERVDLCGRLVVFRFPCSVLLFLKRTISPFLSVGRILCGRVLCLWLCVFRYLCKICILYKKLLLCPPRWYFIKICNYYLRVFGILGVLASNNNCIAKRKRMGKK